MEIELKLRNIPGIPQQDISITYKETKLKQFFKPDFICYDKIMVEIKAVDRLASREEAQLLNYLKAAGLPVGLLINFGADRDLEWKRRILTSQKPVQVSRVVKPTRLPKINDPKPISDD